MSIQLYFIFRYYNHFSNFSTRNSKNNVEWSKSKQFWKFKHVFIRINFYDPSVNYRENRNTNTPTEKNNKLNTIINIEGVCVGFFGYPRYLH